MNSLLRAYRVLLRQLVDEEQPYEIKMEEISVEDKMEEILGRLEESAGNLVLQDLFVGIRYRREAYALFLALLELLRLQRVAARQVAAFGNIIIYRRGE